MSKVTGTVRHIHKYYRLSDGVWHCSGYEGCTHYMPKNMPAPAGRLSRCWSCDKPFQLAPYNMRDDKPICDDCTDKADITAQFIAMKEAAAKAAKRAKLSPIARVILDNEDEPTNEEVVNSIEEDKPEVEDV